MPEQWMSVAQAAAEMKVHPRTIERRIAAGKINSRKNLEGQVEVGVAMPDMASPAIEAPTAAANQQAMQETVSGAFETVKDLADRQVDIAAGSASALIRVAQEQTYRADAELTLARQDAGRYRRDARLAITMVVVMLVGLIISVGWCAKSITASDTAARQLTEAANKAAADAQLQAQKAQQQSQRAQEAEIARAKAEGELTAYKIELPGVVALTRQPPALPATRPSNVLDRLATLFVGE